MATRVRSPAKVGGERRPGSPNAYIRWSGDEEKLLMKRVEEGMSLHEIAKLHGRDYGGIKSRKYLLAYRALEGGAPLNLAFEQKYRLTKGEVKKLKDEFFSAPVELPGDPAPEDGWSEKDEQILALQAELEILRADNSRLIELALLLAKKK